MDLCFGCCIHGPMNAFQVYQADSINQTDMYIRNVEVAAANQLPITDEVIFRGGTLYWDELLPEDRARLERVVDRYRVY